MYNIMDILVPDNIFGVLRHMKETFASNLSYNLYWWNLFIRHRGGHRSAGRLIARTSGEEMYDFMAFQE